MMEVNDVDISQSQRDVEQQYEEILEQTTQIIEDETGLTIPRNTENYVRFATHLRSLLKRLSEKKSIDTAILQMYQAIQKECQKISDCVDRIGAYFKECLSASLNMEEKLYLTMHVYCVCNS